MREFINENYFDKEAELGSDNEEHDDVVKQQDNESEDEEGLD